VCWSEQKGVVFEGRAGKEVSTTSSNKYVPYDVPFLQGHWYNSNGIIT
jgi:hypothetical protein